MKDTIIIQFKTTGAVEEFDWLVGIENALIQAFAQNGKAIVDGHDFGGGSMNIFVFPTACSSSVLFVVWPGTDPRRLGIGGSYSNHCGALVRAEYRLQLSRP